eukprot:SAG11_NODE_4080_length_2074_cov_1.967089_3_plen_150_part_00
MHAGSNLRSRCGGNRTEGSKPGQYARAMPPPKHAAAARGCIEGILTADERGGYRLCTEAQRVALRKWHSEAMGLIVGGPGGRRGDPAGADRDRRAPEAMLATRSSVTERHDGQAVQEEEREERQKDQEAGEAGEAGDVGEAGKTVEKGE